MFWREGTLDCNKIFIILYARSLNRWIKQFLINHDWLAQTSNLHANSILSFKRTTLEIKFLHRN